MRVLPVAARCQRYGLRVGKRGDGNTGVTITQGKEKFTLRFDCKPCEMHVVGKINPWAIKQQAREVPLTFYRTRPAVSI